MGKKFEKRLKSEIHFRSKSQQRDLTRYEREEIVKNVTKDLAYISKEEIARQKGKA